MIVLIPAGINKVGGNWGDIGTDLSIVIDSSSVMLYGGNWGWCLLRQTRAAAVV